MVKRWAAWPPGVRWLAGIVAVVLAAAVVWALFVPLADWLARHDVSSAGGALHETALDNARGRLLTLAAGLVAGGALVFTALNFNLLRRNSEQTDQWQRRTYELTEQGQVTDRYTKAIEQLGSKEVDVRIGGIYALERIARDSARDHPTVMEVLTAFIREHSRKQWPPSDVIRPEQERSARPDVQAALTVILRRDTKHDIRSIDLTGADLTGAEFVAGFELTSEFVHEYVAGGYRPRPPINRAKLAAAKLVGAKLAGTDLGGADLVGADLTGADLGGADLTGADLTSARLHGADLGSADLTVARLTDANLADANLAGADLADADLTRATWPAEAAVPEGWKLDAHSGLLEKADTSPRSAEPN